MRLSTSTIVMAVVTCGLFGLAIRETVAGKGPRQRGAPEEADAEAATNREHQRESTEAKIAEAAEQAEELARTERMLARKQLYGAEVAMLGNIGVPMGTDETMISGTQMAALHQLETTTQTSIKLETDDHHKVRAIVISPGRAATRSDREELCDTFDEGLRDAWGDGEATDHGRYWISPTAGARRASLDTDDCALMFEAYVDVEAWVNKTPASVIPVWAVGQPANKLYAAIGHAPEPHKQGDVVEVHWTAPGVGSGRNVTWLGASIVKDKVARITVGTEVSASTITAIQAQLLKQFGSSTSTEDGIQQFTSRPPITLDLHDELKTTLIVGRMAAE